MNRRERRIESKARHAPQQDRDRWYYASGRNARLKLDRLLQKLKHRLFAAINVTSPRLCGRKAIVVTFKHLQPTKRNHSFTNNGM